MNIVLMIAVIAVVAVVALTIFALLFIGVAASRSAEPRYTHCSVCGAPCVSWEGQYCSSECEQRLAKSMDDWHDRFEDMK